jgi:hypothetical protein
MAVPGLDRYSATIPNNFYRKERIMKIRKNLEAVFLVAAIVAVPASYAAEKVQVLHAAKTAHVAPVALDAKMQVVVVTGHRLSAAEKAALD